MPIQLNAPNLGGLASSGAQGGIPNLSVPGALGLQALQIGNANRNAALDRRQADEAMLIKQGLQQQQLAQQGLLANQQNQLEQQKLAQQNAQFGQSQLSEQAKLDAANAAQQQQFGLDTQKVGIAQQGADLDKLKLEMAKTLDLKKDELQARGAFASYGLMAMKNAGTPAQAELIRQSIIKEALAKKYITPEEAAQGSKMPLSQFQAAQASRVMQYGQADDFHKLMAAQAPAKVAGGVQLSVDPTSGAISYSSTPTAPVQTAAQTDLLAAKDNSAELRQIYSKVPDEFFGASALKQPTTKVREWAEKIPVVGALIGPNAEDKKALESYSGLNGASEMLALKVIKQLSGVQYSDKQLEFLKQIIPTVGSGTVRSEFEGKAQNLFRLYDQIKKDREDLLQKGFKLGTPEYAAQMANRLQSTASVLSPVADNGLSAYLKGKGYSDEDIAAYMKRK